MTPEPAAKRRGAGLLELAPTLLVAVAVFFLLCAQVADQHPVWSDSMQPTIHGARHGGDLVLVNKLGHRFAAPKRFDLVVFRGSKPGQLVVKRCVAVGPATIRIQDGDLYQKNEDGHWPDHPIAKHPLRHADLRVPVFRHPDPGLEQTVEVFLRLPPRTKRVGDDLAVPAAGKDSAALLALLQPGTRKRRPGEMSPDLPGFVATNKPVDTSYLTPAGSREWQDRTFYSDIGLTLEATLPAAGLLFVLEYHDRDYGLLVDRSGVRCVVQGKAGPVPPPVAALVEATEVEPLAAVGGRATWTFGYLDGHLFLVRDGALVAYGRVPLARNRQYRRPNRLHVGWAGGDATIHRVEVFHDLAATRIAEADHNKGEYTVDAGYMFVLGDNAHDSTDSRFNAVKQIALDRLVGRPLAVIAPFSRARMFAR